MAAVQSKQERGQRISGDSPVTVRLFPFRLAELPRRDGPESFPTTIRFVDRAFKAG